MFSIWTKDQIFKHNVFLMLTVRKHPYKLYFDVNYIRYAGMVITTKRHIIFEVIHAHTFKEYKEHKKALTRRTQ